ncbi:E3 ubiquitin-protein ligase lrsam1 [Plakobranchus ocellatus]|uniref:E3 ubiquitin-protein ligase lrsam1 n=1 Tax=Plakobranchus ocellatus TaxID=259542 RepID=A0AAV3YLY7_9GAST|nr:E3 ubiquitin-protein ligase lrsam1 [Plakobranchus ocellatus]
MLNEKDSVIEQHREALEQHREVIEQKDHVIEQNREVIEHKDIELEMKDKEVEDLQRHIRSLMAELDRRKQGLPLSDDEDGCSAASSDTEHRSSSNMSRSSSSPSDSDSEPSTPDEFPVASCKVCLVKPSQILFLPCKHVCCCERCAARLHGKNCPICREQNLGYEKVYVI